MSNSAAIGLALILIAAVVADQILWAGGGLIWIARNLFELIDFIAFWR